MRNHFESSLLAEKSRLGKWLGLCAVLAGMFGVIQSASGAGVTYNSGTTTWTSSTSYNNDVVIGSTGTATLLVKGGNTTASNTYVADQAGSSGTVQITSGTFGSGNTTYVGGHGSGTLVINGGVMTTGTLYIAYGNGSSGALTVTSGTLKADQQGIWVGRDAKGSLTVSGGYVSSVANLDIGYLARGSGTATLTGGTVAISSTINVGLSGTGTLTTGSSSVVTVGSGTVVVGANAGSVGTLNLGDGGNYTGSLSASSGPLVIAGGSGSGTVNFNASSANSYSQKFTGSLKVNQIGSGTTTLTGTSNYSGLTTVSLGELKVNGSLATSGTVKVTSGGRLSGSGTVGNVNVTGGTVAPGNSPGTISVTSLTLDSASTLEMQITGTTAGTFDLVKVSDSVSLSGTLALSGLDALTELGATITLIQIDGTAVAKVIGQFTAVTASGTNVVLSNGSTTSTFTYNDVNYEVDYNGGDGNDVTITVVPEPNSWALLIGALGFLAWRRRRRGSW